MEKEIRQSNIELLRVVLILMIICHHVVVHGLGLKNILSDDFEITNSTRIEVILNSFLVLGVNTFVFISGYFGIKFNIKKVIFIVVQVVGYSVVFYLAAVYLNKIDFDIAAFGNSFFPIGNNTWWFITKYIGLFFLSPFLNAGIETIKKPELSYVIIGLFVLNCTISFFFGGISGSGYSLFNFIFLYLIGRIIRQNEFEIKNPILILLTCTGIICVLGLFFVHLEMYKLVWHLYYYNNPILILSAISLFFIFYKLKIKYNKIINVIAKTVLGIYIIHDYQRIRDYLANMVDTLRSNHSENILILSLMLMLLILSIFLISSLIEFIRLSVYNSLIASRFTSRLITVANTKYIKWQRKK